MSNMIARNQFTHRRRLGAEVLGTEKIFDFILVIDRILSVFCLSLLSKI